MRRVEFAELLGGRAHGDARAAFVESREPADWIEQFVRAAGGAGPVFVANPDWGREERAQFQAICHEKPEDWDPESGWLMIPTGGSSGNIKLARHDHGTLLAAVVGMTQHFDLGRIHSLGTLPMHHVGGFMAWLRSRVTGGVFLDTSWRRIAEGGFSRLPEPDMVLSVVPTQLARLRELEGGEEWLRGFAVVLIGGAALPEDLRRWAHESGLNLAPSYGATETAALAAALRPIEFLAGEAGVGQVLPHLQVEVSDAGTLVWRGGSVFRGYWPGNLGDEQAWRSDDGGAVDAEGRLVIEGRRDALIVSGGEKVNPEEVEQIVREFSRSENVMVVGLPDAVWGEQVVLAHGDEVQVDLDRWWQQAQGRIARFKWPKVAVSVEPWPRNAMGKVNRRAVKQAVGAALGQRDSG